MRYKSRHLCIKRIFSFRSTMEFARRSVLYLTLCVVIITSQGVISNHRIRWKYAATNEADFLTTLKQNTGSNEFYYLFTGDTQYYVQCTPDNVQCLIATSYCNQNSAQCKKLQSNHANRLQMISLKALIGQLADRGIRPKGVVINGDLTDFGQEEELNQYRQYWNGQIEGVRIYPGLGNHDYQYTVNVCNQCATRLLKYYTQLVQGVLQLKADINVQQQGATTTYRGSLAYSWDECVNGKCVHFVQLNNYPGYETKVYSSPEEWTIESSLNWLEQNLKSNKQYPFVINFHNFEAKFSEQNKQRLRNILSTPTYRTLAILFAHVHPSVGPHPYGSWCINGKSVPLLYSGSVPANNYIMIRFDPDRFVSMNVFHVDNETVTSVRDSPVKTTAC